MTSPSELRTVTVTLSALPFRVKAPFAGRDLHSSRRFILCETSVVSLHREPFSENLPSAIDEMVVELCSFSSRHSETCVQFNRRFKSVAEVFCL
jgi:hypothetical protein